MVINKQDFLAGQMGKVRERQERDRAIKKGIYQMAVSMESKTTDSFSTDLKKMQEKALKAAKSRTETRVQTGSEELSEKEWKKLLKRVDQAIGQEAESEEGIER